MSRVALRVLQVGAIVVVLIALPYTIFDLDRFLIPKELVLHLTAVLAGIFAFRVATADLAGAELAGPRPAERGEGGRRPGEGRTDMFLALFLLLSLASALLATNRWLGLRALAVSASGIALFWIARGLSAAGLQRKVLAAIALAVVIASLTALLQAYGVRIDYFATTRVPGGTLGNRNFIAHVAAFGLPVCILLAMSNSIALPGVAIVSAALVLTRSRAAYLGSSAMILAVLFGVIVIRDWRALRRIAVILIAAAIGVGAALVIPNTLHWRSDNPYLESVQDVANFQEGSGRGRLVQYTRSLLMSLRHPLFGVGPGNWPVEYPAHAGRNDPSLNPSAAGMTYNPWPSSDWIAFVSERGLAATVVLALALLGIAAGGGGAPLHRVVIVSVLAAVVVEGLFDAVLLLAVPSFLVWTTLGALSERQARLPAVHLLGALVIALAGLVYSAAEWNAMLAMAGGNRAQLTQAAQFDRGNYRLEVRLARAGGRNRCVHARAAHELFPNSVEAANLSRGCP